MRLLSLLQLSLNRCYSAICSLPALAAVEGLELEARRQLEGLQRKTRICRGWVQNGH